MANAKKKKDGLVSFSRSKIAKRLNCAHAQNQCFKQKEA